MKRALLVVLGVYVCVMGALVHRHTTEAAGVDWPWGLVLAVGATYAVARAADVWLSIGAAWLGLGWGLALLAQQMSPGGDYLVSTDWLGWAFTLGAVGAIVVEVLTRPRLER